MTKEEALEFGKMWLEMQEDSKNSKTYKFFAIAVKALEQYSALDKIKAEIEEPLKINESLHTENAKAQAISLSWCIDIINKYLEPQAESKME